MSAALRDEFVDDGVIFFVEPYSTFDAIEIISTRTDMWV